MVKYLFIEGGTDTRNGNLRDGFSKLLERKLKGKMPRIVMGNGKNETIDKFKNFKGENYLLIDLDAPEERKIEDLKENGLFKNKDVVYYMIQEMEAWFLSQPETLDKFYNENISKKLKKKDAKLFSEPDKELFKLTNGRYHKVIHGARILTLLDADKLINDFPDFKALITGLNN